MSRSLGQMINYISNQCKIAVRERFGEEAGKNVVLYLSDDEKHVVAEFHDISQDFICGLMYNVDAIEEPKLALVARIIAFDLVYGLESHEYRQ